MTFRPNCVITGCYADDGESLMYGDLHEMGKLYIFNAVLDDRGEAFRDYSYEAASALSSAKIIKFPSELSFERRGVVVFHKRFTQLNQNAKDYLHD